MRLEDLALDLLNVRIPAEALDEPVIAAYLVESADPIEMAGDILRDGCLDKKLPVVAIEDVRRVVLEGNRRGTTLTAIHNPSLLGRAAAGLEHVMNWQPDTEIGVRIRMMVAPSREAAQPLLARLHTRNPKKS